MQPESTKHTGGHVKGAVVREFVLWTNLNRGPTGLRATVAALPYVWRSLLDENDATLGLVASTWYPAAAVHRLIEAATDGLNDAARSEFTRLAARAMVAGMLSGVYKTLFSMMSSPERYARHGQKLWSSMYDTGRWSATTGVRELSAQVRFWSGHHRTLYELNAATGVPLLEAMGCHGVGFEQGACIDRGDPECRYTLKWS